MNGQRYYSLNVDGKWVNSFVQTKYTDFIESMGLQKEFHESGFTSPKRFIFERCHKEWIAYQVIKRMEQ